MVISLQLRLEIIFIAIVMLEKIGS